MRSHIDMNSCNSSSGRKLSLDPDEESKSKTTHNSKEDEAKTKSPAIPDLWQQSKSSNIVGQKKTSPLL